MSIKRVEILVPGFQGPEGPAGVLGVPNVWLPTTYGAIGDGTAHLLSERYGTLAAAQAVYPHATALTDTIDWCAIQAAVNGAIAAGSGYVWVPALHYVANQPIDFSSDHPTPFGEVSPISFTCDGAIEYTGTDKAINAAGSAYARRIYIRRLIGSGVIAIGTPEGVAENVGLYIGPLNRVQAKVDRITGFNFGVLFDGSWSNRVDLGIVTDCYKGVYMRRSPSVGSNPVANQLAWDIIGGFYAVTSAPDFAVRQAGSCHYGIHIESGEHNRLEGGTTEYCIRNSDSIGIFIEGHRNDIYSHTEGTWLESENVVVTGDGNTLYIGNVNSPNAVTKAVRVTGVDNHVHGIGNRGLSNRTGPGQNTGTVDIGPGNTVHGTHKERSYPGLSVLAHNLVGNFNASPGATLTTAVNDRPPGAAGNVTAMDFAVPNTATYWCTSNPIAISGESVLTKLKCVAWLKGITNHAVVDVVLLDNVSGAQLGGYTIKLSPDAIPHRVEFACDRGSYIAIVIRYRVRNQVVGETGATVRILSSHVSFNVDYPEAFANALVGDVLDRPGVLPGATFLDPPTFTRGALNKERSVSNLNSNVLNCGYREIVIITANDGDDSIGLINQVLTSAHVTIINQSGGAITVTTNAGLWPANFTIADKAAVRVYKTSSGFIRIT